MSGRITVALRNLDDVGTQWRELCQESGAAPFHWPDWYQRWAEAFTSHPMRVVTAHRGGRLVGVMPLVDRHGAFSSPVNGHTPYFGPVLYDDEALAPLLGGLLAVAAKGFVLQRLPLTRSQVALWDARIAEVTRHRRIALQGVRLTTDARGSWENFLASRSPSGRRELRRSHQRICRGGSVAIEVHRDRDAVELMDACFALEAAGWKGREGTAIATLPATQRFYRQLASWSSEHGWLRLTTLRVDAELAAFSFDLQHGGVLYLLKTAYAEELASFGPGTALTHALVREAFATDDLQRLEWLGDDDSKRALGNGAVAVHRVVVSPGGVAGTARHAAIAASELAGDLARRSLPPRLRARLRASRGRLADQRRRHEGARS